MKTNRFAYRLLQVLPLLLMATLFLSVVSTTTSPLSRFEGGDSIIYKLLGLGILRGRMPYVDLFDNKGTYLYLINALGQWMIPGRSGIFILQIISLTVALCFLYATVKLFVKPRKAILCVALSLFLLAGCYQGGNHVEEWMLPYFAISLYLVVGLFLNPQRFSEVRTIVKHSLVFGLCFGVVFMLRPNDAVAFFGGIMVGLVLWLFRQKEYRTIAYSILSFIGGAVVTLAPIVIWYASKSALSDLWFGMVACNGQVAGGFGGQLLSLLKWGKWAILLLMLTLCVLMVNASQRNLLWVVIPMSVFHLTLIGDKMFAHYFIPLFPLVTLYVVMLFLQKNKSVILLAVAILCLSHRPLPRMAVMNIANTVKTMGEKTYNGNDYCPIPECEKDSVWNYSVDPWRPGVPMAWLVNHDVVQCNRKTDRLDIVFKEADFHDVNPIWVVSYENEFERDSLSMGYENVGSVTTSKYTICFYRRQ